MDLEQKAREVEISIKVEEERLIFERYSVRVGSIVKVGNRTYKVVEIDAWNGVDAPPWLKAVQKKLNGEWGVRVVSLLRKWELVEP